MREAEKEIKKERKKERKRKKYVMNCIRRNDLERTIKLNISNIYLALLFLKKTINSVGSL